MRPGDEAAIDDYRFKYLGVSRTEFADRYEDTARFEVSKGGRALGVMSPFRAFYRTHQIAATRAAIRSNPIEDFYIVPSEFQPDGSAVFRVYVNPLVWWMWASGPVLVLGVLLAISPQRQPAPSTVRLPRAAQTARA